MEEKTNRTNGVRPEDESKLEAHRFEDIEDRIQALTEVATSLLELEDYAQLRAVMNAERPADVADLLRRVDEETRDRLFALLGEAQAAEALVETDVPTLRAIVDDMDPQALSDLVEEMEPDDAADVLLELEDEEASHVLDLMEVDEAKEVQELLLHEEDTGGGLMTPDFVLVHRSKTIADAIRAIQEDDETSDLFYIFVVDDDMRPVGVVPVHRLLRAKPHQRVDVVMDRDVITATPGTDQEEIARLFARYDIMAMPVVDEEGRLVGRITVDDVMDVIDEEGAEDLYKMAGTSQGEIDRPSVIGIAKARLPWLMICLGGSFLSGAVIHLFDGALAKVITLAAFIPAITATGGNSGLQSSTVTVRGLVTGYVSTGVVLRTIAREMGTALVIGMACGLAASAVAWLWFGEEIVGLCVGLAMFVGIAVAVILGVLVPIVFSRIDIDPAVASGPFITTTNDILGLFIYLGLATLLLRHFG